MQGIEDIFILQELGVEEEFNTRRIVTSGFRVDTNTGEDRVVIRESGSRDQDNVTIDIRNKGEEILIAIKAIQSRVNP